MKKTLLITILILTLLTTTTTATEQYLFPGTTRDSTYTQGGTGMWTGTTPITYTRTYTGINSRFPLIADVNGDGDNEIIILTRTNIEILKYETGIGLVQENTIPHNDTVAAGIRYYITPGLHSEAGATTYDIISTNISHMLHYKYNGTEFTLNQSAPTQIMMAGTISSFAPFQNPIIKCARGTQWSTGNSTCVMMISNRTTTSAPEVLFVTYDLSSNTVKIARSGVAEGDAFSGTDTLIKNIHLADGDGDGYLEVYAARETLADGDLRVYKSEVSSSPTITTLLTHNLANTRPHTDIIVNDMAGNGGVLELTFGYSSDGTNYDAATYNANTGAAITASYCTVLTCPEGNQLSVNMIEADDTTYCSYTGDVYYYIRNYNNNDPTANTDTILCLSQYAGDGFVRNSVANTINFSQKPVIHQASLHGTTGLLTPKFTLQGSTKQSLPLINDETVIVPVDYQESGSLDFIGITTPTLTYYDDNYINQNYEYVSYGNPVNPVCQLYTYTLERTITDDEGDAGNCFMEELYVNGTSITNFSNQSVTEFTAGSTKKLSFYYYADVTGQFILKTYCKDQYNIDYVTNQFTILVSNDSTCNDPTTPLSESSESTTAEETLDEEFTTKLDSAFEDIGISGSKAKSFLWLLIMIGVAIMLAKATNMSSSTPYIIAIVEVMLLVLGWVLGMIGMVVIVTLSLLLATLLVMMFVFNRGSNGG